uniref:Calcineurin-like phosphoesterase domain-containing protein n=1 Tax=Poecilia latipinna TaxID=48699 RepID=A0A3B3V4Q9_9TELE
MLWVGTALTRCVGASPEAERQWTGPFCFVQAADPQLGLMKSWRIGDKVGGGDEWEEEVVLTKQAVAGVNQLRPRPRFMVLCGDLVNAMPGRSPAVTCHIYYILQ